MASVGTATGGYVFKSSMDKYAALEGQKRESPAAERNKQPIADVLVEYLASRAATPAADGRRPMILEIASGSGQHAAHIASRLPGFDIQPTDVTDQLFGSIAAYAADASAAAAAAAAKPGIVRLPPLLLDAAAPDWPEAAAAALSAAVRGEAAAGASLSESQTEGSEDRAAGDRADGGCASTSGSARGSSGSSSLVADAALCVNMCHISPLQATRGLLRGAGRALRPGGGLLFVYGPFTRDRRHTSDSNAAFDASLRSRNAEWGYRDVGDMVAWAAEAGLESVEVRDMPANNFMLVFRRP